MPDRVHLGADRAVRTRQCGVKQRRDRAAVAEAVPDVADDVELADSVSMAMMLVLVLETLAPIERALFVLREVFELDYDEIGALEAFLRAIETGDLLDFVLAVRVDDGLITGLYAVRNPEKLSHTQRETVLGR